MCKRRWFASHLVNPSPYLSHPDRNRILILKQNPSSYRNSKCSAALRQVWSAFREPSFGHGLMDFLNDTTAVWNWQRNQDPIAAVNSDKVGSPQF